MSAHHDSIVTVEADTSVVRTCKRAIDSMMDNKLVSMDARLLLPQGVDDDLMFCVGLSKDGLGGACRGDHGSPIVRFYKFADNQIGSWVLLGVLAGGVGECGQEELQVWLVVH